MMKIGILKEQKGVALVIALMMLLILTLIGINAVTTTTFETNIAGNQRLYNTAFYISDGGLEDFRQRVQEHKDDYLFSPISTGTYSVAISGSQVNVTYTRLYSYSPSGSVVGGYETENNYYVFRATSEGVVPNFPTAARIATETIIEISQN